MSLVASASAASSASASAASFASASDVSFASVSSSPPLAHGSSASVAGSCCVFGVSTYGKC